MKRRLLRGFLSEMSIRLALLLVFLVTEQLSPFYREIQPEEMWLYKFHRVGSDHVPTTLMFSVAVFTPLIVILVFTFQKTTERGDLKEASLAVTLTLVLNGVFTNVIKLIVGRPRPDFFYRCFPDGQMNLEMRCSGDPDAVMEGRKSFPSGHSSCEGLFTKNDATPMQRRHERKKEKRKKSARLQVQEQEQEQNLDLDQDQSQAQQQAGPTEQTEETHVQPRPTETPPAQTEKPQKTVIKTEPKTPKVPKVHHPSVIQETGFCKEFVIGDLVWSKVGTYPWWPCMVSSDPQMKVHTRINTRGHREYHVQFFGSVAERAWIHEKRIVLYQGKQQYEDLQAETLRKASNPVEKHKLLKPIPQRERSQWEVGVGHAEDALVMSRQERIDNYTFIYVDPDPIEGPSSRKPTIRAEKRNRRSGGSVGKKEEGGVKSPEREQPPRRLLPRRQCSVSNAADGANSQASHEEKSRHEAGSPKPDGAARPDSPPPVRAWKTAAARKLLPLSVTMKRLNVEITKCDWPLLQKKVAPSPKKEPEEVEEEEDEEEEKEERVAKEARLYTFVSRHGSAHICN